MVPSAPPQNIQWVQSPALAAPLGPSSAQTVCRSCGQTIFTSTSRKAKSSAWWSCILLCIFGCFFGCCLIPCCMDSCNVVNHTCPNSSSSRTARWRYHDNDFVSKSGPVVDAIEVAGKQPEYEAFQKVEQSVYSFYPSVRQNVLLRSPPKQLDQSHET